MWDTRYFKVQSLPNLYTSVHLFVYITLKEGRWDVYECTMMNENSWMNDNGRIRSLPITWWCNVTVIQIDLWFCPMEQISCELVTNYLSPVTRYLVSVIHGVGLVSHLTLHFLVELLIKLQYSVFLTKSHPSWTRAGPTAPPSLCWACLTGWRWSGATSPWWPRLNTPPVDHSHSRLALPNMTKHHLNMLS